MTDDEPMIDTGGKLLVLPVLPYGNPPTSGHTGSDTSRDRAVNEDSNGTTRNRQHATLAYLRTQGTSGATWKDLARHLSIHHGAASGVLSNLHKAGTINRLNAVRDRCKVYVLPQFTGGRLTEPAGRTGTRSLMDDLATLLSAAERRSTCDHLPNVVGVGCWNCAAKEALRHYNSITGTHL